MVAGRIRQRHRLRPQLDQLLHRVLRHVPGAGHQAHLALQALVAGRQHLGRKVDRAVAGRLRPDQAPAPVQPLAGQNPRKLVSQLLVHAEQKPDLTRPHPDVAGRHIRVRTDVPEQLAHEAVAETHDFEVGLALGVEVRTPLAPAHGKRRQGILENLLEGQKLQNPQVHRRVEAQAPLVRPDRAVHLDPETPVDLDHALVVHPRHPEQDHPLRLHDPLRNPRLAVDRVAVQHRLDRIHHLADRLMELLLVRVPAFDMLHDLGHTTFLSLAG